VQLRAQLANDPASTLELDAWRDASWFETGSRE
jgi:hypothetical protein